MCKNQIAEHRSHELVAQHSKVLAKLQIPLDITPVSVKKTTQNDRLCAISYFLHVALSKYK